MLSVCIARVAVCIFRINFKLHDILMHSLSAGFLCVASDNGVLNPLTPNDHYRGRTAPLTSKVAFYIFIQQI